MFTFAGRVCLDLQEVDPWGTSINSISTRSWNRKNEYEELLEEYQFRLLKLQRKIIEKGIAVAVAYEGCDAAGKGGNIKRVTESLDPRGYEVHPHRRAEPGGESPPLAAAFLAAFAAARPHRHL